MANEMETDEKQTRPLRSGSGGGRPSRRRRVSRLSAEKIDYIDYKDVKLLQSFIAENGKIMPRRLTGVSAWQQRRLTEAVKRARNLALLPYTKSRLVIRGI
jgi:small subunit ribosomal protein S18